MGNASTSVSFVSKYSVTSQINIFVTVICQDWSDGVSFWPSTVFKSKFYPWPFLDRFANYVCLSSATLKLVVAGPSDRERLPDRVSLMIKRLILTFNATTIVWDSLKVSLQAFSFPWWHQQFRLDLKVSELRTAVHAPHVCIRPPRSSAACVPKYQHRVHNLLSMRSLYLKIKVTILPRHTHLNATLFPHL